MGPTDTDDLKQKLRTEERTLFHYMLVRLSIVSLVAGAALYCMGVVLDQQGVVATAAMHTILPLGVNMGIIASNDSVWRSGSRLRLQVHKLCGSLLCALLCFDLGALCGAIGT